MIRKIFRKKQSGKSKVDIFLEKYNLPKAYLSINRRMITIGIAVGLFWAFIPMPMQMLAVMATTPFIRFNVPIAISMVWLSNPLTMPPMYYMEYLTGNFILGKEGIDDIELTMEWFADNIADIFIPLYVGTAFYSIVVTTIVYITLNWLWIISVKDEREKRKRDREEKRSLMEKLKKSNEEAH